MNLTITKNHAADPEIRYLQKSISKSNGCATAIPTAWELKLIPYWAQGSRITSVLSNNSSDKKEYRKNTHCEIQDLRFSIFGSARSNKSCQDDHILL